MTPAQPLSPHFSILAPSLGRLSLSPNEHGPSGRDRGRTTCRYFREVCSIRFHLEPNQLVISAQNAEEGEARETIQTDYNGEETDIGFNAQYLQDFLNVIGDGAVAFEFKDGNSQAQLRPAEGGDYEYKYVVMPMRL